MAGQVYVKSGKTFRYESEKGNVIGRGAYGRVFAGHFKPNLNTSWGKVTGEEKKAAIKRVEISFKEDCRDIKNDREVVALKELRNPCIVRLFAVEDDDNFRNYIFELCQGTLEDFITKKYGGLMPDEIEGLYQMSSGLKFIHEKKMIHRDIKPENVLISVLDGSARLKICDFGFTKRLKDDGIHYDLASGLKGTEYYMAPELLVLRNLTGRVLDKDCTIATDVFAAGCTFFRYLNGGLHPFGEGFNIEVNIMEGKPINATKYGGEPQKTNFLSEMVKLNPKERPSFSIIVKGLSLSPFSSVSGEESLSPVIVEQNENYDKTVTRNVGDVQFDLLNLIGRGSFGAVFRGTFKGEKVAVKRVELVDSVSCDSTEVINNKMLLNHPNIVQFKHYVEDLDFRYIVMELYAASLMDFIDGRYEGPMPTDEQVLFQLANGLDYIHSMGIFLRDIKPEKILISLTKPVQMKFCDIGWRKSERKSSSANPNRRLTNIWLSPEELRIRFGLLEQGADHIAQTMPTRSVKSEIFSAGCVFIFFLLRGLHPFGNRLQIPMNILEGSPVNELPEEHFARPFVLRMIAHKPKKRISLREVIDQLTTLQPASRLSLLQYDNQNLLCSTGTLSLVYHIGTFEGSPLAVKRVLIKDCTTKSFDELKQLDHSNIIRLLHYDNDDFYRYFGMELCVASLDKLFLPEDDPKKYTGLIPITDEQFCFQLISGLEYIHGENLVHGSIKPTNILISSSQDPQIKLSDFGLTTSRLNEGHTTKRVIGGFLSSQYWLAPELLLNECGDRQFTKESDIFAAGSVFFYFLSKGCHLFGDINEIIPNTLNGIPKNYLKTQKHINYFSIIPWMTTIEPGRRSTLSEITEQMKLLQSPPAISFNKTPTTIGNVQFFTSPIIGIGGQAAVFHGFSKGFAVAVKRMLIDTVEEDKKRIVYRERESFLKLKHSNIVELIDCSENETFMVLALEKCLTSLDNYCQKLNVCRIIPMPSEQEVLLQMAKGLEYIHSQGLIHRDVKPANILISRDNPAVIKWADFGMSRAVVTGSKTFSWSKFQGTDRWLAPELITASQEDKIKGSQKCDIFALGCVFFFFLVPGVHPFGGGDDHSTKNNIKDDKRVNFDSSYTRLPERKFVFDIIKGMIENDREKRSRIPFVVQQLSICTTIEDDAGRLSLRADV